MSLANFLFSGGLTGTDPYANLEGQLKGWQGAVQYQPGMDYSNYAFARPYDNSEGPQAGWWMVPKEVYNRMSPQTSSGNFLSELPTALNDMKGGLAVALGGPAAGGAITSLTSPTLASLAPSGGNPAFWDGATASAGVSDTGYGAGIGDTYGVPDTFTTNTGANPNNIFTTSPGSLGELSAGPGSQSMYELAGASGVPATGVAAIDAPGQVVNLNGGGMTGPASFNLGEFIKSLPASAAGVVKQFLSSNPSASQNDLMSLIGKIAPAALGAYASGQQAGAYKDLADKYLAIGAPSRGRYEASFQPGFDLSTADPGYKDALAQTTKETLNRLSPGGNPAGSPNAWNQTLTDVNTRLALPALQNYRSQNAASGGLGTLTSAAPAASSSAINAGAGVYNSVGAGAANVFNPPRTLADILKEAKAAGY